MKIFSRAIATLAVVAYFAGTFALVSYGVTLIWGHESAVAHHAGIRTLKLESDHSYDNVYMGGGYVYRYTENKPNAVVTWLTYPSHKHHVLGAFAIGSGIFAALALLSWLIYLVSGPCPDGEGEENDEVAGLA